MNQLVDQANGMVMRIRNEVARLDSMQLIGSLFALQSIGKARSETESGLSDWALAAQMGLEYVLALVAADGGVFEPGVGEEVTLEDASGVAEAAFNLVILWTSAIPIASRTENAVPFDDWPELDDLTINIWAQWISIRGDNYSSITLELLECLLAPHAQLIGEVFSCSPEQLVSGLGQVSKQLRQSCYKATSEVREGSTGEADGEPNGAAGPQAVLDLLASPSNFHITEECGLPRPACEVLSFKPGEDPDFVRAGPGAGWLTRKTVLRERPILKVDDQFYSPDIYSLLDRAYRRIKSIALKGGSADEQNEWRKREKEISEELAVSLVEQCIGRADKSVGSAHYQFESRETGALEWAEVDGLIQIDDALLVVEVKGGKFTDESPAEALDEHLRRVSSLLGEPIQRQANRFLAEMQRRGAVEVYSRPGKKCGEPIGEFSLDRIDLVVPIAVTIEQLDYMTSHLQEMVAEKCDAIPGGSWPVSVGDLLMYTRLFRSPVRFLHFLEQRARAFTAKSVKVPCEQDHFGLYCAHSHYVDRADEYAARADHLTWHGYSDVADKYFGELENGQTPSVPERELPKYCHAVIDGLDQHRPQGWRRIGRAILSLDDAGIAQIERKMAFAYEQACQSGVSKVLHFNVDCDRVSLQLVSPGATCLDANEAKEYVLDVCCLQNEESRVGATVVFEEGSAGLKVVSQESIGVSRSARELSPEEVAERSRKAMRIRLRSIGKKVGRNEPCPCGSGSKFKKCCMQLT